MSTVAYPHIVLRSDGVPIIDGRGIKVQFLAEAYRIGRTVDDIVEAHNLTPSQVYSAWTYYFDHKAEMDQELDELEEFAEKFLAQQGKSIVDLQLRDMSDDDLRELLSSESDPEDKNWILGKLREVGRKLP